jgi:DNA-binding GntR family transcriptional regulator
VEIIKDGPVPPYRQIAAWLRDRIIAGEFASDQRLPGETDIVNEFGVARTTARRVFRVLRDEGWAYTVQARGTFVSPDRPTPPADERK